MKASKRVIYTKGAPKPIGPYSQAVVAGGVVYCAGQIPLDPRTGSLVRGDLSTQTRLVLQNLRAVLKAAGSSLEQTVKLTVYLKRIGDFGVVNQVLSEAFPVDPPARAVLQAAALPKDAQVEIELVALAVPTRKKSLSPRKKKGR